ncbi:MAG: hypothetical protein IJS56_01700 [Bacilli bacterium]|nr:hypothetical protein [Bacilli bacterium]
MGDTLNVNNYNYLFPLRLIRIVRNQSVPDFAISLGASRDFLWSLEAGRILPSDSFLSENIGNLNISYEDYKIFENEIAKIKKLKVNNSTKYQMALFKTLALVYSDIKINNNSNNVKTDEINAYQNVNDSNQLLPFKLIRTVRNQSISGFATSLRTSKSFIWRIERGIKVPSDLFLSENIGYLNISYEDYKIFENEIANINKLKVDNSTKYQMALFKALVLVYPELNSENKSNDLRNYKIKANRMDKSIYSSFLGDDSEIFFVAEKCSYDMLIRIFGTMEEESILDNIFLDNCIISSNYLYAVYNRIVKFPIDLVNAKKDMPGLIFDPFYLSDALVEGYTFGIVNRIINYCKNENIPYNFEDKILMVEDEVVAVNNELLVSVFEINKKLSGIKRRNKVK